MRRMLTVIMLLVPVLASAQDSAELARLDQEVRQLQREVLTLSQLVTQLRSRIDRDQASSVQSGIALPRIATGGQRSAAPGAAATESRWINAAAWRSLRTGMSDLDVIAALGAPTSTRGVEPERILLYALEIGPSSFLAGSVTLRDRAVVSIETPVLK